MCVQLNISKAFDYIFFTFISLVDIILIKPDPGEHKFDFFLCYEKMIEPSNLHKYLYLLKYQLFGMGAKKNGAGGS